MDPEHLYLGASPDGVVSCECCGRGLLEVKCPFCMKEGLEVTESPGFCLDQKDDQWKLRRGHAYYYQVQMQMFVCKLPYCNFVVWSRTNFFVERVTFDEDFFQSKRDILQNFFIYGMMPEIVGKWYTRKPVADVDGTVACGCTDPQNLKSQSKTTEDEEEEDYSKLWCYCNTPSSGDTIRCDNSQCTI